MIIDENGGVGACAERSAVDGVVVQRFMDNVFKYMYVGLFLI